MIVLLAKVKKIKTLIYARHLVHANTLQLFPILKNFSVDYKGKVDWTDPWRKHVQLHSHKKTTCFNRAAPIYPQDEFTRFFLLLDGHPTSNGVYVI